jgi:5'-methylthioadenosine phosphorylase
MTALPEAKLAREASMCYATLACVTDYDTWHPAHASVTVEMILTNLRANAEHARSVTVVASGRLPERTCACKDALATAIVTPMALVPDAVKADLAPILGRVGSEVTA